ncbi:MAG TPA: protein adenylyltransferase SelO family protein, partial [Bacilli bacterium]|nr:protein adenylyltransferase SelO family protein [Bacilli bacterium]
LMHKKESDFTNTFRALTLGTLEGIPLCESDEFTKWHEQWQARLDRQQESQEASQQLMQRHNPAVIPRNHRVEAALESAQQGDLSVMEKLLEVLAAPYAYTPEQTEYAAPPEPSPVPYRTFCGT